MITIEGHDYQAEKKLAENRRDELFKMFQELQIFEFRKEQNPNFTIPRTHNRKAIMKESDGLRAFLIGFSDDPAAAPTGIAVTHAPCPLCKSLVERDSLKIAMEGKPPVCARCAVKIVEAIESQRWEGLRHG